MEDVEWTTQAFLLSFCTLEVPGEVSCLLPDILPEIFPQFENGVLVDTLYYEPAFLVSSYACASCTQTDRN